MEPFYFLIVFSVITLAALVIPKCLAIGRRPENFPPGPPTVPILGNLHLIPSHRPHEQFKKWAEEYGPIYSLMLGTQTFIVLSSDQAVKDLLDKKSNIYSSRPSMYIGSDVASGGFRFVLMPYAELWRKVHKIMHNLFTIRAVGSYVPYQDLENKQLLLDILDTPNEFLTHIRRFSNSLTTQMVFGFRTITIEDPRLKQLTKCFNAWSKLVESAAAQLLDVYPILQKLPPLLRPKYSYAKRLHDVEKEFFKSFWLDAKRRLQNGACQPCFCSDLLKAQEQEHFSDIQAAYTTGSLLEAGTDTTSATLIGFVQAMMVFPEIQQKVKEEVDRVVGSDRLPNIDDEPNMPYVRSCIKESLRWMPVTLLGVPHCALQDDEYMGYQIPAGATVILNVWGIHCDPKRYPNPRKFDPSRYENDHRSAFESASMRDVTQRDHFGFGAGRRLCSGMRIAWNSLFLGISRLMWAFDIKPPIDPNTGRELPLPDIDNIVGGIASAPAPFKADFRPRSEKKGEMIREIWKTSEADLLDVETKQWKEVPKGMMFREYVPIKEDDMLI